VSVTFQDLAFPRFGYPRQQINAHVYDN